MTSVRYTDEERAEWVVALEARGYPDKLGVLEAVARESGVTTNSLRRWYKGVSGKPPDKIVRQKKESLADKFEDIAFDMLDHVKNGDVIKNMSGQAAVTAAAIATDKMRLLRGLPTEIVAVLPVLTEIVLIMHDKGIQPDMVFDRLKRKLLDG